MTDPKRLVDEGDLGGALLASARGDAPSRRTREGVAAALGITVGVATMAAATTASAASVGASAASAGAAAEVVGATAGGATAGAAGSTGVVTAKVVASAAWLKIVAGGLVTAAVATGSMLAIESSAARDTNTAPTSSMTTAHAPPVQVSPPALVQPGDPANAASGTAAPIGDDRARSGSSGEERIEPTSVAASTSARALTARAPRAAAAEPSGESPLARELRSLDGVRVALDRGDPSGALAALDGHDRAFPSGALHAEAEVLRVEALLARGDTAAARKLASTLLARDPSGLHARRLRSIAQGDAPGGGGRAQ